MRNLLCMVPSTRSTWSLTWDCIDFSWQVGSWSKKQDLKVVIVWQARANWRHNDGQKFIFRFFRPGYRQCMTEHSNALSRKIRLHILVIDDEHVPREILKIISTCSRKRRCSSYISTSSLKQIIPCKQKILKKISFSYRQWIVFIDIDCVQVWNGWLHAGNSVAGTDGEKFIAAWQLQCGPKEGKGPEEFHVVRSMTSTLVLESGIVSLLHEPAVIRNTSKNSFLCCSIHSRLTPLFDFCCSTLNTYFDSNILNAQRKVTFMIKTWSKIHKLKLSFKGPLWWDFPRTSFSSSKWRWPYLIS